MGEQRKNPWNKEKAKVDNNGEDNEEYNNDADKRATHIMASTKKRGSVCCCGDVCVEALGQTSPLSVI